MFFWPGKIGFVRTVINCWV